MPVAATSLKVPVRLKSRIERLARASGESSHAVMLRALETHVESSERYRAFIADGLSADRAMRESGLGFNPEEVHAFLRARIRGAKARKPKPVRWRG
jgi:predicted transcriptional regulator